MRAKKPLLVAALALALLTVALVVPSAAVGKSDNKPAAWANWAQSNKYAGLQVSVRVSPEAYFWVPVDYPWAAAFAVHAQLNQDTEDPSVGYEVMNWESALAPPSTPPWKHNRTSDLIDCKFEDLGEGSRRATLLFRYNTEELGWPKPLFSGDVYHLWVLTDNPGNEMDHVDLYTKCLPVAPDMTDDPGTWGEFDPDADPSLGGSWVVDLDCTGVQVVIGPELP